MNSGWERVYLLLQESYGPDAKKPDPIGAYLVKMQPSGKNADADGCLFSTPRIETSVSAAFAHVLMACLKKGANPLDVT